MFRKALLKIAAAVPAIALATAGVARAGMAGPKLIQAFGGATETESDGYSGSMALAGSVVLTDQGGATALNVTLAYQDNDEDGEGMTCVLSQPSDLSYSFPNGLNAAGTMTLTVNASDSCWETNDPSYPVDNSGNSVTFNLYARNGSGSFAGTGTTLVNAYGESLASPVSVVGTLAAASGGALNALSGSHLINAVGGTTDNFEDSGHLAVAGLAMMNAKGGANALDVTISYADAYPDNISCEITTASDLSYSLNKGIGTLTLTISAADATNNSGCQQMGAGNSITFNLYSVGGQARILSTSSNLVDAGDDVITDPAVVGTF